jgi:hypothetical protein
LDFNYVGQSERRVMFGKTKFVMHIATKNAMTAAAII